MGFIQDTIDKDIHLITITKDCNFVFNCCKIQEISMKIGFLPIMAHCHFLMGRILILWGKSYKSGAENVIFWKIFTPDPNFFFTYETYEIFRTQ